MTAATINTLAQWINRTNAFGENPDSLPGLPLMGNRIRIRRFQRGDEDARQRWAKFAEAYLLKYNFTPKGVLANDLVYQKLRDRIRLAVDDASGQMIGYVSLMPVKRDRSAAELGICFAADQVSRGYGFETLTLILPWACKVLRIERVLLDVDAVNTRAIHLYERFGFRKISESWHREDHPSLLHWFLTSQPDVNVRRRKKHIEFLSWKMEWKNDDSG